MHNNAAAAAEATLNLLRSSTDIRQIHARMIKTQQIHSPHLAGRLVSSLSRRHPNLEYALSVFLRISPSPDTFTHNTLLHSLLLRRSPYDSVLFFLRHSSNFLPNSHTFPLLLKAATRLRSLPLATALHAYLIKLSLHANLHAHTSLLSLYSSLGRSRSVNKLLFSTPHYAHIATWNAVLSGFVACGRYDEALSYFRAIREAEPDEITVVSAISACAGVAVLDAVKWMHTYVIENGFTTRGVRIGTAMVDAYARCGCVEMAREVFWGMEERNVMSWTVLIRGLGMSGCGHEAVGLFDQMVGSGVRPDDVAFVAVLSACSHSGMVSEGRCLFDNMEKIYGVAPKVEHFGCLVDMLCRDGRLDEALDIVTSMPMSADAALWGCLLSACRRNPENIELAEDIAAQLAEAEPGNEASYVLLSQIYACNGRWDDVSRMMTLMKENGALKMPGCSSAELYGVVHEFIVGKELLTNNLHKLTLL